MWRIHEFISDQGPMYLNLYLLSVSSKVRWRNMLCFITKPQQLVLIFTTMKVWKGSRCTALLFLTSALEGGGWSMPNPSCFTPGNNLVHVL